MSQLPAQEILRKLKEGSYPPTAKESVTTGFLRTAMALPAA